jgi:hypothetical protein
VDGLVGVEAVDVRQEFRLSDVDRKADDLAPNANGLARRFLVAHIDGAGGDIAHQDDA